MKPKDGAEGKEKGKGVTARWGLEETQSKSAGRRVGIPPKEACGTPGTSWHVTAKSPIRKWGVLNKSGVYARIVLCLTLGDLPFATDRRVRSKLAER